MLKKRKLYVISRNLYKTAYLSLFISFNPIFGRKCNACISIKKQKIEF